MWRRRASVEASDGQEGTSRVEVLAAAALVVVDTLTRMYLAPAASKDLEPQERESGSCSISSCESIMLRRPRKMLSRKKEEVATALIDQLMRKHDAPAASEV